MTLSTNAAKVVTGALVILTAAGCGTDGQLPTYRVTGKVMFPNGNALEGGTIIFESVDHPVSARSAIELDGTFRLGTYEEDDGAVAGKHRVAITPPMDMSVDRDQVRPKRLLHPRYSDMEASGLEFEVKEDGPNEFEVQVSRR